jgi:hypothetical protein
MKQGQEMRGVRDTSEEGIETYSTEESTANNVTEEGWNHGFPDIITDCKGLWCLAL